MQGDLVMAIALLKKLELFTEKEAENLYEELKYQNLSMDLKECINIVDAAFKKHSIKQTPESAILNVDGKNISITK